MYLAAEATLVSIQELHRAVHRLLGVFVMPSSVFLAAVAQQERIG